MYSVTSDAASSVLFQTAPKPARSDQSPAKDSFGALIDSNTVADSSDRASSAAQQQSPSPRRSDDRAATADSTRSRDAASTDPAAKQNSDDRDAASPQTSDTNANAKADTAQRSGAKSNASKAGATKSVAKSSSDDQQPASDSSIIAAASAQPGEAPIATPSPVAVVLAVAVPTTDVPAATPVSGNAAAPLAIAAAAIAASSSAIAAPVVAASPEQIKIDSDAAAAVTASAAAGAANPNASATAKIAVQAAASEAIANPVKQQAAQTDAIAAADVALTVAATAPVAPKSTLPKAAVTAQAKSAASGNTATASAASDSSAAAAPIQAAHNTAAPPAIGDKQEGAKAPVDALKADTSAGSSSPIPPDVSARDHSPVTTATGHTLTDSPDTGLQATGTIQPQLSSTAATATPVASLSVMPATNAAVPLSGLALEIAASARSGKSRFDIRLDPADLGRIDVRINVDRNGQVTSHLTVEKPETLSMLRQDAPQLQRALDDAGFKTGSGGLQFSLRDHSSSGQNGGNETGRNAHRLVIAEEETIPASVAGRTYGRALGSSSGVDIRV